MQKFAQKTAEIVKLDKGFPLISVENTQKIRAEFNANLSKKHVAVAVGDKVRVSVPLEGVGPCTGGDDPCGAGQGAFCHKIPTNPYSLVPSPSDSPVIIEEILPRVTELIRNDPVNRRKPQVLAANFDHIAICVAAGQENFNHLTRMLVIACNAGVPVTLVFTKCDLGEPDLEAVRELVENVGPDVILSEAFLRSAQKSEVEESPERACSLKATNLTSGSGSETRASCTAHASGDPSTACFCVECKSTPLRMTNGERHAKNKLHSVTYFRGDDPCGAGQTPFCSKDGDPFAPWRNHTTILLGKSGVGKSTLINALAGKNVCKQGEVREFDSKGRHTTVTREIIETENYGRIVDMPGVRSLGLINCERGLRTVFSSIFDLAQNCKFRDCKHSGEPGCAVAGNVSEQLLNAYHELCAENEANSKR